MSIYDEISKTLDSNAEKIHRLGPSLYDAVKEKSSVLDVGCSSGYFGTLLIETKQCSVDGVEIDLEDIKKAKKVLGKVYTFDVEDSWDAALGQKSYDAILFADILEHLRNPGKVLEQAKKHLNKDGVILVSVPNVAHISTRLELMAGSFEYEESGILDKTHLQYFTRVSLTDMVVKAGFEIISLDCSLNEFANDVVTAWLKKLGLTASDTFWETMNTIEAQAFQYKLVLKPTTKRINTKSLSLKPDKFKQVYLNEVAQKYQQELAAQQAQFTEQINKLAHELEVKEITLQKIHSSKAYKLARGLQKTSSRLRKPKKQ